MEKTTWKGSALLAPVPPVLVSCGTMEAPNVLTVAWTGILNSQPPKTYISVRPERYSHDLIKESGEFVLNLPTSALVNAVDYCGVKSGRDENKFEKAKLTPQIASAVKCPMVGESPVSIECRVTETVEMGSHTMFIADILAVNVANDIVNAAGKLCLAKAGLCAYAHGEYFALGRKIGDFGFSVKKKKKKPQFDRRQSQQK
ncbi:MAG: flavin reductase family protein [Ruthenibacterium sp.]